MTSYETISSLLVERNNRPVDVRERSLLGLDLETLAATTQYGTYKLSSQRELDLYFSYLLKRRGLKIGLNRRIPDEPVLHFEEGHTHALALNHKDPLHLVLDKSTGQIINNTFILDYNRILNLLSLGTLRRREAQRSEGLESYVQHVQTALEDNVISPPVLPVLRSVGDDAKQALGFDYEVITFDDTDTCSAHTLENLRMQGLLLGADGFVNHSILKGGFGDGGDRHLAVPVRNIANNQHNDQYLSRA